MMILQEYPSNSAGEVQARSRRWFVRTIGPGPNPVVIARFAIDDLVSGEEINDNPPTIEMNIDEWKIHHEDFGHGVDFKPINEHINLRNSEIAMNLL